MPCRFASRCIPTLALLAVACSPPDAGRPDFTGLGYLRIVAVEDARPTAGPELEMLLRGTSVSSATLRAASVRALGRLENPSLVEHITPLLRDPRTGVRREAANALAQAVHRSSGLPALQPLLHALESEDDPHVLGAMARSLGRLRLDGSARSAAARALVALSRGSGGNAPPWQMEGVALGMASFVRLLGGAEVPAALRERLRQMTRYAVDAPVGDVGASRVRTVLLGTYASLGPDPSEMATFLADREDAVRLSAAMRLSAVPQPARDSLVGAALADPSPRVRLEAVRRGLGVAPLSGRACARLLATAETDPDTPVRLAALDALAPPCPDRAAQAAFLATSARADSTAPSDWHVGAHALASLAAVAPARARALFPRWTTHPNPFARAWLATAAGRAGDPGTLRVLASDPHPNVRTEALKGLSTVLGRPADPELLAALRTADDSQLLLTVAGLLSGTAARATVAEAAWTALARISRPEWETLRDARVALLALLEETGDKTMAARVELFLTDHDPAVARRAADILRAWTGAPWSPAPIPSTRLPLPTLDELHAMERATLVFHMARGGAFEVRLLPWQAATNAARLYRMALAGTLDGLTFHRAAPNFVIQGGSPGANEYAGHGAFTRDEVGLSSNWRGTVGLSTRGRDTGDGQIYVNLVDNVRLDHDFTILGTVTAGMEVVDSVLEGDVIERVEVRPSAPRP